MEAADTTSDVRYVWAAGHRNWARLPQYGLSVGGYYSFRVQHCAAPGQTLVCGELWWNNQWVVIWTNELQKCTKSDGTGSCYISIQAEVRSFDSTPHPTLGGGGQHFYAGQLALATMWVSWDTIYPSSSNPTPPYVIQWSAQWSDFRVCQTACQ
jgi:hypothetical protein